MNILNIGIGNIGNTYIDNLKENNIKIKNFYITFNDDDSYKYSNSLNYFRYQSKVSLEFLLDTLVEYNMYSIYCVYYSIDEDCSIVSSIVEFLYKTNKYINLFPIDFKTGYSLYQLKNIVNNYNIISNFLSSNKISNTSFIYNDISTEFLYTIDCNYLISNSGYMLITNCTDKDGLIENKYVPKEIKCDTICTNFIYEYLKDISDYIEIISEDVIILFGMDLPIDDIQNYNLKLQEYQSRNKRSKNYQTINIDDCSKSIDSVDFNALVSDILNQIM